MDSMKFWRWFASAVLVVCLCAGLHPKGDEAAEEETRESTRAVAIDYDEAWFVALKFPEYYQSKERALFNAEGEPNGSLITFATKIRRPEEIKRLNDLLHDARNFASGTSDWHLELYGIVFYRKGRCVLELVPNLVGNFLGARPQIEGVLAWSEKGIREFTSFCHCQLALAMVDSLAPPRRIGEPLPKYEHSATDVQGR